MTEPVRSVTGFSVSHSLSSPTAIASEANRSPPLGELSIRQVVHPFLSDYMLL